MLERDVGRVLAKLEALHEDILEVKNAQGNIFKRVNQLETQQSWFKGILASVGAVVSGALTWMWKHIFTGGGGTMS